MKVNIAESSKGNWLPGKIWLALIFAAVLAGWFHFWPLASDDFQGMTVNGQVLKVFHQGWPLKYIAAGELKESGSGVALKLVLNFAIFFFAFMVLVMLGRAVGSKSKINV
jgi:hypothetical protein